ncbi:MAG: Type I Iterative PKS [Bathelium mastoideum]|nr:MAG: Type I Iterative PKS [Bathelium mastoideum]
MSHDSYMENLKLGNAPTSLNGVSSSARTGDDWVDGHHTNGVPADNLSINSPVSSGMPKVEQQREVRMHQPIGGYSSGIDESHQPHIAICGMALRLPSGLKTPEQLWNFLISKRDARDRIPESRFNVSGFYDPSETTGTIKTEYGYFLQEDLGHLDTSFFSMSRKEVERADPQQRLMLEVVRECLEDACEIDWKGKTIGCYMGSFGEDWCEIAARDTQNWGNYRATGVGDFSLSNRVSYEMDFKGPSVTIRTACSASLVALDSACAALVKGDCDAAIVGGANLIMSPGMTINLFEQNVLSSDASCKTFSADGDGYARGEGITAIFLKRLEHALTDENPIRAIIRGSATNHDGKTTGYSVPSVTAQEAVIRRAYKNAGIRDFSLTGFVECHGTGTPTGDPIETQAVARVFGDKGAYIGSIKPNLGHTEGASGVLSVIKSVLALEHQTIPPNIKFTKPHPRIPFGSAHLTVPVEAIPWPSDRWQRISVNSFGVGGSNAHVIIDSAISHQLGAKRQAPRLKKSHLLLFSARSQKALAQVARNFQQFVEDHPERVEDIAYTLANKREHMDHRSFALVENELVSAPSPIRKIGKLPAVVMVFTGQGSQWPQMGLHLLDSNAVFLSSIRALDDHLRDLNECAPAWNIEAELRKSAQQCRVDEPVFSQPLCTAIQIALLDTMSSVGVHPDVVVGHSSGEIAAAYAAGSLTAKEAIVVAMLRGSVTESQRRPGAMAAVEMAVNDVEKYLVSGVNIACDNSPQQVTISGDKDKINQVLDDILEQNTNTTVKKLQVNKAYHSYHMAEIGDLYHSLIDPWLSTKIPTKPFFSTVTGTLFETEMDARYWQSNLESPVLFRQAISEVLRHPIGQHSVFLEVGPHSALSGPMRHILAQFQSVAPYIPLMRRKQNSFDAFLSAMGNLYTFNIPLDYHTLVALGSTLPDLPRYPWDHEQSFWFESRLSKQYRQRTTPYHSLLGSRVVESTDYEPLWRNIFHLENAPWIQDHKIMDDIIFPFAAYIAIAGEAVRQLTGIKLGFRVRHVIVNTALVLDTEGPAEIVTSLKRQRLNDSLEGKWWEFSVSSHNGQIWTKHCSGEVIAIQTIEKAEPEFGPQSRLVDARRWFDAIKQVGLDLGPSFQNLGSISTCTSTSKAYAQLENGPLLHLGAYQLHPTIIDAALQLMGIASATGQPRKYHLGLPVSCGEMIVYHTKSDITMSVSTESLATSILGSGSGISDGKCVLKFSEVKFFPVSSAEVMDARDLHGAGRMDWRPLIDFFDMKKLVKNLGSSQAFSSSLEALCSICVLHSKEMLAELTLEQSHLRRHLEWIRRTAKSVTLSMFAGFTKEELCDRRKALVSELSSTPVAAVAYALQQICENTTEIFSKNTISWRTILASQTIESLQGFLHSSDISPFIRTLAHCKPGMRILELGSWRNLPSEEILKCLTVSDGRFLCSKYTFTAKGFIAAPSENAGPSNVEHKSLNLDEEPSEQGFEPHLYDLIVADNVVSGTCSVAESLSHLRKLLHPSGHLLLRESCRDSTLATYIFGSPQEPWSEPSDEDTTGACVDLQKWRSELDIAGLETMDALKSDASTFSQTDLVIVACPKRTVSRPRRISILHDNASKAPYAIPSTLEQRGFEIEFCTLDDEVSPGQDVVCLLDQDRPFFDTINPDSFYSLRKFVSRLSGSGVFWITGLSQIYVRNPAFAQVLGLARTLRSETLTDFATCEADDINGSTSSICDVFVQFYERGAEEALDADSEYIILENIAHVGRIYPFSLTDELLATEPSDSTVLDTKSPGQLQSLCWISTPSGEDLRPYEVQLEMCVAGLNFRDVLVALNLVELPLHHRILGLEGAGVVKRVGSHVESLSVGDRVMTVERKTLATLITTTEPYCIKIPDNLSDEEASTMLIPYATAWHSLMDVGRLEKGQSVLIHSACSGVGLAALQIAQMVGAELYTTVGTDEKVAHLMEQFGLPRDRIFSSRDQSFAKGILEKTRGEGVHLVLNSLYGELLHLTWTCVAPFGIMVEIGKRDLIESARLDMKPFLKNRTYSCVDIDAFAESPGRATRIIRLVLDHIQKGTLASIRPISCFDASSVTDAFKYMQSGQHIGRIAVSLKTLSTNNLLTKTSRRPRILTLDQSASYLLVGGLGGLGRAVSTWMVENGARSLIFLSRSAGVKTTDKGFIQELTDMGCNVQLARGSVTDINVVNEAIRTAARPLKGIIQMSMILHDINFFDMTFDQWHDTVSVKVQGTRNLHDATVSAGAHLDFFVLFSSLSCAIGQPGQANYASANTFLDAFVQYRACLGLPASSIDIGAIRDVGVLSRNPRLRQKMERSGWRLLNEKELLDALHLAIVIGKPRSSESDCDTACKETFIIGAQDFSFTNDANQWPKWSRDRRMAIFTSKCYSSNDETTASDTTLRSFIKSAKTDPAILKGADASAFLAAEIGKSLFALLSKPQDGLDTSLSLLDLGMDSLVATELRAWWKCVFGFDVSILELRGLGTLDMLGRHAAEGLRTMMQESTD